jgi:hypothetical protein
MEAGLEYFKISSEGLVDSQFAGGDLIYWTGATAANTGAPYSQTSKEIATTFEAGLIASAFEFLSSEVLEILLIAFLNRFVMWLGHVIYIMLFIGRAYYVFV